MKTSFRYDNYDIYITVKLIDGRIGYDIMQSEKELVDRYTRILIPTRIKMLELVSDIANPILKASIIYEDDQFEQLMNSNGNLNYHCKMTIRMTDIKLEENIKGNEDIQFDHDFYVDSVEVIERSDEVVTYKIDLISSAWFAFDENVSITSYSSNGVSMNPVDLLGKIFQYPLELYNENDKSSNVEIEYISHANSTRLASLYDILAYSMYRPDGDLILTPFDHMENRNFIWFKSKFEQEATEYNNVEVDKYRKVVRINVESIRGYDPFGMDITNIKTINFDSNSKMMDALRETIFHQFDYTTKTYSKKTFSKDFISNSFGPKVLTTGYSNRLNTDLNWFTATPKYTKETAIGNEKVDWKYMTKIMTPITKNGTVLINTTGNIYRKPGIDMFLVVDSTSKDFSSLLCLQGRWLLTKIRHIFKPKDETYTNNLLLSRLDIPDDAKSFRETI